ncbi:MAG: MerR family transcriptional regulator [Nitrospirae bacterium]|nr:MerR family transcriptional regulator [Nitrospirota bacterium]
MGTKKRYKTKEICDIFDISRATLFRWEDEGLISNVGRDWRNWRLYSDKNIKEIEEIIKGKSEK